MSNTSLDETTSARNNGAQPATDGHHNHAGNGSTPTKPDAIQYRPDLADVLPTELTTRQQFVVWRYEKVKNRWTKVPYNARTGAKASSTNPNDGSTFDEAIAAHTRGQFAGIGFVLSPEYHIVGI